MHEWVHVKTKSIVTCTYTARATVKKITFQTYLNMALLKENNGEIKLWPQRAGVLVFTSCLYPIKHIFKPLELKFGDRKWGRRFSVIIWSDDATKWFFFLKLWTFIDCSEDCYPKKISPARYHPFKLLCIYLANSQNETHFITVVKY